MGKEKFFGVNSVGYVKIAEYVGIIIGFLTIILMILFKYGDSQTEAISRINDLKMDIAKNAITLESNNYLLNLVVTRQNDVLVRLGSAENKLSILGWIHKDIVVPDKFKNMSSCRDSTCHNNKKNWGG